MKNFENTTRTSEENEEIIGSYRSAFIARVSKSVCVSIELNASSSISEYRSRNGANKMLSQTVAI